MLLVYSDCNKSFSFFKIILKIGDVLKLFSSQNLLATV